VWNHIKPLNRPHFQKTKFHLIVTGVLIGSQSFKNSIKMILSPSDTSTVSEDYVTVGVIFVDKFSLIVNVVEKTSNLKIMPCLTLNFGEKGKSDDRTFVINIEPKNDRVFNQSTENWKVLTDPAFDKYTLSMTKGVLKDMTGRATNRTIQFIEDNFSITSMLTNAETHKDFKTMLLSALSESEGSFRIPGSGTTLFLNDGEDSYFTVKFSGKHGYELKETIETSIADIKQEIQSLKQNLTVEIVLISSSWSDDGVNNFTLCSNAENETSLVQCNEFNVPWFEKTDADDNDKAFYPEFVEMNEIMFNTSLTVSQNVNISQIEVLINVEPSNSLVNKNIHDEPERPIVEVNRLLLYTKLGRNILSFTLKKLELIGYKIESLFSTFFNKQTTSSMHNVIFLPDHLSMVDEISNMAD